GPAFHESQRTCRVARTIVRVPKEQEGLKVASRRHCTCSLRGLACCAHRQRVVGATLGMKLSGCWSSSSANSSSTTSLQGGRKLTWKSPRAFCDNIAQPDGLSG